MSHYRLPSFNELTSNFSNNLQIESSNQSNKTSPAPNSGIQTPNQVRNQHELVSVSNAAQQVSNSTSSAAIAAATHASSSVPPPSFIPHQQHQQQTIYQQVPIYQHSQHPSQSVPPPPISHIQPPPPPPPPQQQQQHPHHPHPQHPFHPPPQQYQPPQQQQFGRPLMPQRYPSELTRYQFPKQEPNYVTANVSNDTLSAPNSSIPPNQQQFPSLSTMNFNHDRRLSMQYPPYPSKHVKKDSYDSQTSLSTLADIASSNEVEDEEYKIFLHSMENLIDKFKRITNTFNDVNYDFLIHLEKSMNESKETDEKIKLNFEYKTNDGKLMNEISPKFLKEFVSNIPMVPLKHTIQDIDYVQSVLQKWLNLKKKQDDEDEQQELQPEVMESIPSIPKTPKTIRNQRLKNNHSRTNSRNFKIHQSISGASSGGGIKKKQDHEPFYKTRRSNSSTKLPSLSTTSTTSSTNGSSSNSKNDSISLVVNPPKPVIDLNDQEPPKGNINQDLSIKVNLKCFQCGSDETPEWRRGPYGSRSLCNACGLFFGKLTKKFDEGEATRIMMKRKNQGNGDDRRIPID
ncbi:hypothetical protein BN7_337 [Wickerhamomyces ciferrii]|uniref:GATA-type domain-containing protein n=1 Tax=Wickerhamomyces ciferrii (strain ATCC 14091 / BCRC 22168 / CBS 111 / JCM 3599 / NBRC 0793 / NRRL Y-1031 F-60-10) TaxID=1206466 RepID=K0KI39_WICCF|nr:uncharacterized protein BN7_337 [Wickerhamomyces ciferrii]CCH40803.1 hypothetical protein BN7_337 [Wickerhamomyces ciferrii]